MNGGYHAPPPPPPPPPPEEPPPPPPDLDPGAVEEAEIALLKELPTDRAKLATPELPQVVPEYQLG
jgi:protein TonB